MTNQDLKRQIIDADLQAAAKFRHGWSGKYNQGVDATELALAFAEHRLAHVGGITFDVGPLLASVEDGPEPSLRSMIRSFYNRHAIADPDGTTDQYIAAVAETRFTAELPI